MSYRSLVERLADPDFAVRKRVVRQLVQAGKAAVPDLIAAVSDPRTTVQTRAIEALGRIGDPSAVEVLVARFRARPAEQVWRELIIALTRLESVAPEVASVLSDTYPIEYSDTSAPRAWFVQQRDEHDRLAEAEEARQALQRQTHLPEDVHGLVEMLRHPVYAMRKAAGDKLARLGAAAIPAMAAEARSEFPLSAVRAIEAVGQIQSRDAVTALVDLRARLRDPDLKAACGTALYHLLERCAPEFGVGEVEILVRVIERWQSYPAAAQLAVKALVRLAETAPCPELRRALKPLKGSFLKPTPPEFTVAWKVIDAATSAWADLPLPASAPPPDPYDLPRPSEEPDVRT